MKSGRQLGMWNAKYIQLLIIEFLLQIGLSVSRPIVSLYALELGSSVGVAGALSGMLAVAALTARPLSGLVADSLDKSTLLVVACVIFGASTVGIIATEDLVLLGVFLFVQGFAFAIKSSVVIALAAGLVPKGRVGAGIGWMSLAYTASQAIGPFIGSAIGSRYGYISVFDLSACLLFLGFVFALKFKLSRRNREMISEAVVNKRYGVGRGVLSKRSASSFIYRPALPLSLVAGLLMVSQGTLSGFVLYIGASRDIDWASLYFLCYAFANLLARPIAGQISDRTSASLVVKPMLLVAMAAVLCLAFVNGVAGVLLCGVLLGVGQGSAYSVLQAESVRGVCASESGRAANTFYIGPDIGMGFGPALVGAVMQHFGITAGLLTCALLTVLSFVFFSFYWARMRKSH